LAIISAWRHQKRGFLRGGRGDRCREKRKENQFHWLAKEKSAHIFGIFGFCAPSTSSQIFLISPPNSLVNYALFLLSYNRHIFRVFIFKFDYSLWVFNFLVFRGVLFITRRVVGTFDEFQFSCGREFYYHFFYNIRLSPLFHGHVCVCVLVCGKLEWCSVDFPVRNVTRTLADFRLTAATCATSLLNGESSPNSKPRKSEKPKASRAALEKRRRAADRLCTGGKFSEFSEFSESVTKGKFALPRNGCWKMFFFLSI